MKRKEAEKIALKIIDEGARIRQEWLTSYSRMKILMVPMDVLSALVVPDRSIKVIEGELSKVMEAHGIYDVLDGKSPFLSDATGLCGGSVKVRITIENLEAKL